MGFLWSSQDEEKTKKSQTKSTKPESTKSSSSSSPASSSSSSASSSSSPNLSKLIDPSSLETLRIVGLAIALSLGAGASLYIYQNVFKRVRTAGDLTPSILGGKRKLFGRCVSVGDGDNFRFFHTPGGRLAGWDIFRFIPQNRKILVKQGTIHVRLAGVDAPEMAHFGNPAQPYSQEAFNWLTQKVKGKRLRIQPWSRDRYERVVSSVKIWTWTGRKDVSLEMVKAGLATVYVQAGAEYGGIEQELKQAEEKAK